MKHLLILSSGGGNDAFSGLAYAKTMELRYEKIFCISMLGLTPFHSSLPINLSQYYNVQEPILIEPSAAMTRYIMTNPPTKIKCLESLLPDAIKQLKLGNKVILACLSSKYSIPETKRAVISFLNFHDAYSCNTEIHLVDFGGDILTNGETNILSPELDAFSLALVANLKDFSSRLIVCFPGTDGEIEKEYLRQICFRKGTPITYPKKSMLISLQTVNELVKNLRPGNTIPNMIRILTEVGTNSIKINKKWRIDGSNYFYSTQHIIDAGLSEYFWQFDIQAIYSINPFCSIFEDPNYDLMSLIWNLVTIYSKTKDKIQCSDLYYNLLRVDHKGKWSNRTLLSTSSNIAICRIFNEELSKKLVRC